MSAYALPDVPLDPRRIGRAETDLLGRDLGPVGEAVHVRIRVDKESEVPDLVLWEHRLWSVRTILDHQIEQPGPSGAIAEHVWWVVAVVGRFGDERVCELGQSFPGGQWRLRSVSVELPARFQYGS